MRTRDFFALLLIAGSLTACQKSFPVVGFWESEKRLGNDKKNKLEVYDDFTGEAKIYALSSVDPNTWIRFKFDVLWEDLGEEFEFDLDCTEGPCSGDNFDMVCEALEVTDDGEVLDKLDCEGERKWDNYPLQWERE